MYSSSTDTFKNRVNHAQNWLVITILSTVLCYTASDMDPYKKLCEVGTCLCKCKMYELCIKVLDAAQQLETNQIGITMKVQLTLGNAHSALKHKDLAVTLYQVESILTHNVFSLCTIQTCSLQ